MRKLAEHLENSERKYKAWKEKNTKEKVISIVKIVFWVLAVTYVVLVLFAGDIFGPTSYMAKILGARLVASTSFTQWFVDNGPMLLTSVFLIFIFIGSSKLLRFIMRVSFARTKRGITIVRMIDSFLKYLIVIIMILVLLYTWGVNTTTLLASAGVFTLVIGLGAQSLISDVIAGLFIVFEGDFQVGDIVVIDDFRGEIKQIGIRATRIVDTGGNVKIINNSKIPSIVNMSNNNSIAVCDVAIAYGESIERVEAIIKENFPKIKESIPDIKNGPFYKGVQSLADSRVILRIIAECDEENIFQVTRDLNRQLKLVFDRNNIFMPFNQITVNAPKETSIKATNKEIKTASQFNDEQKEVSKDIKNL